MRQSRERLSVALLLGLAALLRLSNLGQPDSLVFDELYYVDGARDFLKFGVEIEDGMGEFIVHPPLGKWLISLGIFIFGDNPFGWRFSAALAGLLSILFIYLIARKVFHSPYLALMAMALATLDGLLLVMSRTALLDIFLTLFLLAGTYFFLQQRLLLTAITLGGALAIKWSAIYLILLFLFYLAFKSKRKLIIYSPIMALTYLSSWIGWFLSDDGWSRRSSGNSLLSLFNYHREILNFHTGLTQDHSYQASPIGWLLLLRPTSFFYDSSGNCQASQCSQEVLAIGTPLLWWFFIPAVIVSAYFLFRRANFSLLVILAAFLASYLPWFAFPDRTTFYFYSVALAPFLILLLVNAFSQLVHGPARRPILIGFTVLVAMNFLYFHPLFVGEILSYEEWQRRIWFKSWI